jgi:hypothetical protein
MNETNRTAIVILAGIWIILMAVVIFLTWAADLESIGRLEDAVQFMDDHRDNGSKLILTLSALVLVVVSMLVIILELAPEEESRELKVEQAGSTMIVPADALRQRLEDALTGQPRITEAAVKVFSRDKGIATSLDLTVTPDSNVAAVVQEATRVVEDVLQTDLGLPAVGTPAVRIAFGGAKLEPVASSAFQPPAPPTTPEPPEPWKPAEKTGAPGAPFASETRPGEEQKETQPPETTEEGPPGEPPSP